MSGDALDPLLARIPGDNPAGSDLRYDPAYDRIQELRREDDPNVPQGIWTTRLKRADWGTACREIEALLATRSKDLQLASWLTEAMLQVRGLPGLAQGLRLVTALCVEFWPGLYPEIDRGDLEGRLAPLHWLDEKLPLRIAQLPLSVPVDDEAAVSWQTLTAAQRLEPLAASSPQEYQDAVEGGAITLAAFGESIDGTPTVHLQQCLGQIQAVGAAARELRGVLEDLCGPDAPTLDGIGRIVAILEQFLQRTLAARGLPAASPPPEPVEAAEDAAPATAASPAAFAPAGAPEPGTRITTRQQAYRALAEAADFLLRTEPHSPAPYLVRRAIHWGGLSLGELLQELVEDEGGRQSIQALLRLPGR